MKTIAQDKSFIDPAKLAEYELRDMIINIYLKFYIAVNYANDKNYEATYAIALRVKEDFQRCLDFYNRAKLLETSKGHREVISLKKFAEKDIEYILCKTKAALMFEHQRKLDSLNQDFDKMEVKEQTLKSKNDSIDIVKWLFNSQGKLRGNKQTVGERQVEFTDSNLNILETGGKNAMMVESSEGSSFDELLHKKAKLNKKSVLVELYPKFQPVMPKPFFFDIAGEAIEFPDLEQMIKQLEEKETKGTGLFGRLKSTFFG